MAIKELKQIWNSVVAVAVAVATITVAIMEQQQRKFCPGYLQNCDLQFPKMTYAHHRLPFTLIFSYKMSTHHKEKRGSSPKEKNHKKTKENEDLRKRFRVAQEEKLQRSIGSSVLLIILLFSVYSRGCVS